MFLCCPSPLAVASETAIDCPIQRAIEAAAKPSSMVNLRNMKNFVPRRVKTLSVDVTSMNQVKILIAGVHVFFSSGCIVLTARRS